MYIILKTTHTTDDILNTDVKIIVYFITTSLCQTISKQLQSTKFSIYSHDSRRIHMD